MVRYLLSSKHLATRTVASHLDHHAGLFDHAMMRFKAEALQQQGRVGALFRRLDGTLAHYFSVGMYHKYHVVVTNHAPLICALLHVQQSRHTVFAEDIRELMEGAGLQVDELEYACVLNKNRKKGTEMKRVFVHCLATKTL
jgi:hypothetical protein